MSAHLKAARLQEIPTEDRRTPDSPFRPGKTADVELSLAAVGPETESVNYLNRVSMRWRRHQTPLPHSPDCRPQSAQAVLLDSGKDTLFEQTRRRVSLSVSLARTVTVLTRAHEQFYSPVISETPLGNLVIQPANRGTAAAILFGLLRLSHI